MKYMTLYLITVTILTCTPAYAWYPPYPTQSRLPGTSADPVIGQNQLYKVRAGDTLVELAPKAGLGFLALLRANAGADPWLLPTGGTVLLPYAFLLPPGIQPGITVNLAEMRLYYLWRETHGTHVRVYPVGIGRSGWDTPEGKFEITRKIVDPAWNPPASLRRENPQLPSRIPPGADNPLGEYWLGLSRDGYGIHGTNKPYGVGRRISHGCLRLYPADIRDLFARVETGTAVYIINRPLKFAHRDNRLFMEVHRPQEADSEALYREALEQVARMPWRGTINLEAIRREIALGRGVPTLVGGE